MNLYSRQIKKKDWVYTHKNKQERFLSGALDSINKGNMERAAALYEYYKEVLGGEKRIDELENILNEKTTK